MKRKRIRRKPKEFPPYRKFDGKRYRFYSLEYFKGDANRIGRQLSRRDVKYRIIPNIYTGEGYLIYISGLEPPHPSYLRD